jgi:hypothetical protein
MYNSKWWCSRDGRVSCALDRLIFLDVFFFFYPLHIIFIPFFLFSFHTNLAPRRDGVRSRGVPLRPLKSLLSSPQLRYYYYYYYYYYRSFYTRAFRPCTFIYIFLLNIFLRTQTRVEGFLFPPQPHRSVAVRMNNRAIHEYALYTYTFRAPDKLNYY